MIEINSETDFVAKNDEFINFAEEISEIIFRKFRKNGKYFKIKNEE